MPTKEMITAELENVPPERLEALYQIVKSLAQTQPAPPSGSFMAKLRAIKIDAPADFATDIDPYRNGEITTRLDPEATQKLADIQQQTSQDLDMILAAAIALYYQQIQAAPPTGLNIMQNTGFVGCFAAETDFSARSQELLRSLHQSQP